MATGTPVRVRHPQQSCRSCASRLKHDGAAGVVLKTWMQGWRVTCRAYGAVYIRPFADGVDGAPGGIKRAKMVVV